MANYKLLLVDDDDIIREEIKDHIKWDKLGFDFVGGCVDGRQALKEISAQPPDVILADICMPHIDGLELAHIVSERYPKTKTIILTCYDKFDYAQKAVKLNVYDFLLKPVTPLALIKILKKIKKVLDGEKKEAEALMQLNQKMTESIPIVKEHFLKKLISNRINQRDIQSFDFYSIKFGAGNFLAMVLEIDTITSGKNAGTPGMAQTLSADVFNTCGQVIEKCGCTSDLLFDNEGHLTLLLNAETIETLRGIKLNLAEKIRKRIETTCACTVTIGVGTECGNLFDIPASYQNAREALKYRFQFGTNRVINYDDLAPEQPEAEIKSRDWGKEISLSLKTRLPETTENVIKEMIRELKSNSISLKKCYTCLEMVIISIYSILEELEINEKLIFGERNNPFDYFNELKTLDKIEEWLLGISEKINRAVIAKKGADEKKRIREAIEFIKAHYEKDLTLSLICRQAGMSKSKFSLLFKKYTDRTFIEFLTSVRLEKSKQLLKTTNMKSYEIALTVGFKDPHYFAFIFKKGTCMTPTQFKNA